MMTPLSKMKESVVVPFLWFTISLAAFWNPSNCQHALNVGNSRASWSVEKRPPNLSLPGVAAPKWFLRAESVRLHLSKPQLTAEMNDLLTTE